MQEVWIGDEVMTLMHNPMNADQEFQKSVSKCSILCLHSKPELTCHGLPILPKSWKNATRYYACLMHAGPSVADPALGATRLQKMVSDRIQRSIKEA